ncbi:MAG: hypothetical protein PHR25_00870 [Clostridia bacterium]|nr:hypothetical protein [Clostridia bacterium]
MSDDAPKKLLKYGDKMGIENTIRLVKKVHPNNIVLVKIGTFYHVYYKDSYILAYLFNYKMKPYTDNCKTCGFPLSSLNKVSIELEKLNINYMVLDRRDNYEVTYKEEFKNNNYEKIYNNATIFIGIKNRIENVNNYFLENIDKKDCMDKLKEVEEIIYESRKI